MDSHALWGRSALRTALSLLLLAQSAHALPDTCFRLYRSPSLPLRTRGGAAETPGQDASCHLGQASTQDTNRVDLPDGTSVGPRNGGLLGQTFETAIPLGEKVVPLDAGSGSKAERRLLASYLPDALRFRFHFLWFTFGLASGMTLILFSLSPIFPRKATVLDFVSYLRDNVDVAAQVRRQALRAMVWVTAGAWLLQYWTVCGRPRMVYRRTEANQRLLSHCPALVEGFTPTPFLFNGWLQTLWMLLVYWPPRPSLRVELIPAPDGGEVTVEWCMVAEQPERRREGGSKGGAREGAGEGGAGGGCGEGGGWEEEGMEPLVVVVPGVAGCGRKSACRGLMAECLQRGWSSVCVTWRGYCGSALAFPLASHLGFVDDVDLVVREAKRRWPRRRLLGVGLSMGGHALMRYFGGMGEGCLLEGGVALSAGFSIVDGFRQLHRQWMADLALNFRFKDLMRSHPALFDKATAFAPDKVRGARRTVELDRAFTCRVGGWDSPEQYQEEQSASRVLHQLQRPLLALNALDDSIVDLTSLSHGCWAGRHSDHFVLALTPTGGHAGFFEGLQGRCWMNVVCCDFLAAALATRPPLPAPPP